MDRASQILTENVSFDVFYRALADKSEIAFSTLNYCIYRQRSRAEKAKSQQYLI